MIWKVSHVALSKCSKGIKSDIILIQPNLMVSTYKKAIFHQHIRVSSYTTCKCFPILWLKILDNLMLVVTISFKAETTDWQSKPKVIVESCVLTLQKSNTYLSCMVNFFSLWHINCCGSGLLFVEEVFWLYFKTLTMNRTLYSSCWSPLTQQLTGMFDFFHALAKTYSNMKKCRFCNSSLGAMISV